jgi:hypothetical protein
MVEVVAACCRLSIKKRIEWEDRRKLLIQPSTSWRTYHQGGGMTAG